MRRRRVVPRKPKRHTGEYIVAGRDVKIITDTGLTVRVTEADPASIHGVKWRVRLGDEGRNKGAILINRSHIDFLEAERAGWSAERTYMLLLLLMSISLPLADTPERAEVFREEFEEKFLRFSKPLIPKIPSKAKKQAEDE
jgi:MinD superfamily P-loop ATPase